VHQALTGAGAPEGTIGLAYGFDAGIALVEHERVSAVAFTGSEQAGMALWRAASARTVAIPVFAEMGTVNSVTVTPRAGQSIASIADGFVGSFTMGSGQFCTKPGMMLAPRDAGAPAAVAAALTAASPRPVMLTERIARSVEEGVGELVAAGATILAMTPPDGAGWAAPATVLSAPLEALVAGSRLLDECFGAVALVVEYARVDDALASLATLQGALAASVWIEGDDDPDAARVIEALRPKVGRVVVNGWPTGVSFTWAQQHGGPWPATTDPRSTSVGAGALDRFVRPVAYQGVPEALLPAPVRVNNPWGLPQRINGRMVTSDA
jgi:NADP-dependent aldehyde dehydrogenase